MFETLIIMLFISWSPLAIAGVVARPRQTETPCSHHFTNIPPETAFLTNSAAKACTVHTRTSMLGDDHPSPTWRTLPNKSHNVCSGNSVVSTMTLMPFHDSTVSDLFSELDTCVTRNGGDGRVTLDEIVFESNVDHHAFRLVVTLWLS